MRWDWRIGGILICAVVVIGSIAPASFADVSNGIPNRVRLLSAAEQVQSTMKSSKYQHTTYVDEANGVYDFDCSGFVDYLLQRTSPDALAAVKYRPNRLNRPYHQDYYRFLSTLRTEDNGEGWLAVARASDLLPGDIIVWLKPNRTNYSGTGHVMIVRSNPTVDSIRENEMDIQIIDSTRSRHGFDTRVNGTNGVGIGTISLALDATGKAVGFRWRDGASPRVEYTRIAFGEVGSSTSAMYGISNSYQMIVYVLATVVAVCGLVGAIRIRKLKRAKSAHTSSMSTGGSKSV